MHTPTPWPNRLTPEQHTALYEHARQRAAALRREAIRHAWHGLSASLSALVRRALRPRTAARRSPLEAAACPR